MLRNYLSVMIIPRKNGRIIRFELSAFLAKAILAAMAVLAAVSAGVFLDYLFIREKSKNLKELEKDIMLQKFTVQQINNKIVEKRQQLENFEEFDRKLRLISGLQESGTRIRYVGGTNNALNTEDDNDLDGRTILAKLKKLDLDIKFREISFFQLAAYLQARKDKLARKPSIAPTVGHVSSRYGPRKDPFTGKSNMHRGLDISNRKYTPIVAPADGEVVNTEPDPDFGKFLVINHGYDIVTRYGHLESIEVSVGESVKRGDTIARMGNTGRRSTGSHLHYEVLVKDQYVNPEKYIILWNK
ncbi:MAG: M23 family metallopeptidase [Proteobacteria bacterium]|nr:M23 family metallopeptidase [Pseudomonadota bacterium]